MCDEALRLTNTVRGEAIFVLLIPLEEVVERGCKQPIQLSRGEKRPHVLKRNQLRACTFNGELRVGDSKQYTSFDTYLAAHMSTCT